MKKSYVVVDFKTGALGQGDQASGAARGLSAANRPSSIESIHLGGRQHDHGAASARQPHLGFMPGADH